MPPYVSKHIFDVVGEIFSDDEFCFLLRKDLDVLKDILGGMKLFLRDKISTVRLKQYIKGFRWAVSYFLN